MRRRSPSRFATLAAVATMVMTAAPADAGKLNNPPQFTGSRCGSFASFPLLAGATSVVVTASDPDAFNSVALRAGGLPSWASFSSNNGNAATGTISGDPTITDFVAQFMAVPADIVVTARDTFGAETTCSITPIVSLLFAV